MEFSGRCEMMRAPTTENDTVRMVKVKKISPRVRPLRRARIWLAVASATHSTHSDQAIQAADRMLIPALARSCSLAPSVTTPLYNTTVSQALRGDIPREYLPAPLTTRTWWSRESG